jgi:hypothetical protein
MIELQADPRQFPRTQKFSQQLIEEKKDAQKIYQNTHGSRPPSMKLPYGVGGEEKRLFFAACSGAHGRRSGYRNEKKAFFFSPHAVREFHTGGGGTRACSGKSSEHLSSLR